MYQYADLVIDRYMINRKRKNRLKRNHSSKVSGGNYQNAKRRKRRRRINWPRLKKWDLCWLIVLSFPSTARSFRDGAPIYCRFAKDMKLGFCTVTTGNRTPGRCVAVHYTTTEPHQLHLCAQWEDLLKVNIRKYPFYYFRSITKNRIW